MSLHAEQLNSSSLRTKWKSGLQQYSQQIQFLHYHEHKIPTIQVKVFPLNFLLWFMAKWLEATEAGDSFAKDPTSTGWPVPLMYQCVSFTVSGGINSNTAVHQI